MTKAIESAGERFRRSREEAGITQQQLADYVGVSRAAVSQWESGNTQELKAENAIRAARKLGKNPEWLITGEGPEQPANGISRAIGELPAGEGQQVLDFLEYRWQKAEGIIASDKIAHYTDMIERFKRDLDRRRGDQ